MHPFSATLDRDNSGMVKPTSVWVNADWKDSVLPFRDRTSEIQSLLRDQKEEVGGSDGVNQ